MSKKEKVLMERHAKMLKFQREMFPEIPTMGKLAELWGLTSRGHAHSICNKMLKRGLVEKIERGVAPYRAIQPGIKDVCPCCGKPQTDG